MDRLKNKEFREELAYSILKKFAKKQGWKEYRYDDGFYMFGPDDEKTRLGVEEKAPGMVKRNGGIAMKTFPSYDNTLCNGGCCCIKETCVRYLTHLKAVKDRYPYPISYMMPKDNLVNQACDMYVKAE